MTRRLSWLVAAVVLMQAGGVAARDSPHALAPWVRADVVTGGPGMWSVSVRYGGYYSGHAIGIDGEFSGQLRADQREALVALVARLPRQKARYRFGTAPMEGPDVTLEILYPTPRRRFSVAVVSEAEQKDDAFRAVVELVESLKALVPPIGKPVTPW